MKLRQYIEGIKLFVRSDQDSMGRMKNLGDHNGILDRWRLKLSAFNFTVVYRPGLKNQVPDALLRCIDERKVGMEVGTTYPRSKMVGYCSPRVRGHKQGRHRNNCSKNKTGWMNKRPMKNPKV